MAMNKITIVAEIGINHNGVMDTAEDLICSAVERGADLVKFQLYDVDTLFPTGEIISRGINWYDRVKPTQLSQEQAVGLFKYGRRMGIEVFFSVFDLERFAWCEDMGVGKYKVARGAIYNRELQLAIRHARKPAIVSVSKWIRGLTGGTHWNWGTGTSYLYCISKYPTELVDLHLEKVNFKKFLGYSDHTLGIDAVKIAMSRGAVIIEKHFTLDKDDPGGPDHICSMNPLELQEVVRFARKCEEALI